LRIRWDTCLVVIQIGVNDASAGVAPEAFKSQLEELIGKLQKSGAQVIQCTCTCRVEGYNASDGFDKKLDALAEAARAVAREKKLPLVDLRSAFIDYWKKHNPDNQPRASLPRSPLKKSFGLRPVLSTHLCVASPTTILHIAFDSAP
jgi:lysophospholipase L1-like esterase